METCRYPECVDDNEDKRCADWLTGDCPGPGAVDENATRHEITLDEQVRERLWQQFQYNSQLAEGDFKAALIAYAAHYVQRLKAIEAAARLVAAKIAAADINGFGNECSDIADNLGTITRAANLLPEQKKQCSGCADRQAKIDRLMLEFCPDEMTPEQVDEWGRNQRPAEQNAEGRAGEQRGDHGLTGGASAPSAPDSVMVPHPDDVAVDEFAAEMKLKLARKRAEGRSGWDDPEQCAIEFLYRLLWNHEKREGQHIDVANLRMMIWQRERAASGKEKQ